MIKILHSVTSDSPDGQPWPPSDGNAQGNSAAGRRLHVLARNSLLKSAPLLRTCAIFSIGSNRN
jgi:hypothetical protein